MSTKPKVADAEKAIIEIKNLRKSFGTNTVLKGIQLDLYKGENLVVLGKSGSGKSVLIKLIAGLLKADSGNIRVFNEDVTRIDRKTLDRLRRKIGFLFQSAALYDSMSVRQNLEFPLRRIHKNLRDKEITAKVQEVLENVGLAAAINKMPAELSGGMRKRIGLARTIIVDPEIILYDEPTTGLDPVTSDEISALMLQIQEQYKTSSIIITHDLACARKVANRMVLLDDGQVYLEGPPELFDAATDPLVQAFFRLKPTTISAPTNAH